MSDSNIPDISADPEKAIARAASRTISGTKQNVRARPASADSGKPDVCSAQGCTVTMTQSFQALAALPTEALMACRSDPSVEKDCAGGDEVA